MAVSLCWFGDYIICQKSKGSFFPINLNYISCNLSTSDFPLDLCGWFQKDEVLNISCFLCLFALTFIDADLALILLGHGCELTDCKFQTNCSHLLNFGTYSFMYAITRSIICVLFVLWWSSFYWELKSFQNWDDREPCYLERDWRWTSRSIQT